MNLDHLSKGALLCLLYAYNKYIQEANDDDRYREGWYPVCISEFYDNEYQLIHQEHEEDWES